MYKSITKITIITIILIIIIIWILIKRGKGIIINNWTEYRCSPIIIPLAGAFGKNTSQNAQKCFYKSFKYFFDILIKPCQYIIKIIQTLLGKLFYDINAFRVLLKPIRLFIMKSTKAFYDKVNNFSNTIIYSFSRSRTILKRMAGTFRLSLYSLQAIQFSMQSIWDGPIGTVAKKWPPKFGKIKKFFCFHPNTKLLLVNDKKNISINDILIGTKLKDNNILLGKVTFKVENIKLFYYNNDLVTGSHLVFHNNKWEYIENIIDLKYILYSGIIICPITSLGIFYSNNYNLYRDFEENDCIDNYFLKKTLNKLNNNKLNNNKPKYLDKCIGLYENTNYYDKILKKNICIKNIKIGNFINGLKVVGILKELCLDTYIYKINKTFIGGRQIVYYNNKWLLGNNFTKIKNNKYIFYSFITDNRIYNINNILFLDILDSETQKNLKIKNNYFKRILNSKI